MTGSVLISISVVSHGQGDLVGRVLADIARFSDATRIEVILTRNIPEQLPFLVTDFPYPLKEVENVSPKGFGANHNAAFLRAKGEWFCVLNPDIRLPEDPFPSLLEAHAVPTAAVVAPAVLSPVGEIEDSVRRFPTPFSLTGKLLGWSDGRYSYKIGDAPFTADWLGGMFMLFRAEDFRRVGGFDEGFFLYYEDVDICARLWKSGRQVLACPKVQVIHDARRTSRRNFRYMRWHLASMARYLSKHWLRLLPTDVI
ncbi:MAG: glycosyltransferase family 2 protein [Pseudomonadota bacterium]